MKNRRHGELVEVIDRHRTVLQGHTPHESLVPIWNIDRPSKHTDSSGQLAPLMDNERMEYIPEPNRPNCNGALYTLVLATIQR